MTIEKIMRRKTGLGAAGRATPFSCIVRMVLPSVSIDDAQLIHGLAHALANCISENLPCVGAGVAERSDSVPASNYVSAQSFAYTIEDLLNPKWREYGNRSRGDYFCRSGQIEVVKAAKQFLACFDKVIRHYGWHTEESRSAWEQATYKAFWGRAYRGPDDATIEAPPIRVGALAALRRAANKYEREVVTDTPRKAVPGSQKLLGKFYSIERRVNRQDLIKFLLDQDLSVTEIAELFHICRGQLYRDPDFKKVLESEELERLGRSQQYGDAVPYFNDLGSIDHYDATTLDDELDDGIDPDD
jgi:hypothetical protein